MNKKVFIACDTGKVSFAKLENNSRDTQYK